MKIHIDKTALTPRMWWRFTFVFVPCLVLLILLDVYTYKQETKHYIALIEQSEQLRMKTLQADVFSETEHFSRSLFFLSGYVQKQQTTDGLASSNILHQLMQDMMLSNHYIDYISFIDHENKAEYHSCRAESCQHHDDTLDAMPELEPHELFISDISLKRVAGEVQRPLTPVMQLATSVFSDAGDQQGMLVLSHMNQQLYHHFDWANKDSPSQTMLLNADAYWLYHPEKKYEWGSELSERSNLRLSNQNPELWQRIKTEESGQFYDHAHLYTFQTLYPRVQTKLSPQISVYEQADVPLTWVIVARYPHQVMQQLLNQKTYVHLPLLLAVILMLVLWLWSYAVECLKKTETQLKHNAHNLKQTQTLTYIGSWSWSAQQLQCSEQAYNIFGINAYISSINFKTFLGLVHPDDRKEVKLKLLECMNEKTDYDIIHRIIRMDDAKVRTVHAKAYVSVDDRQQAHMIGVIQDISAQLHDKERIRFLAQQDVLTNVPNRTLFMDRLSQNILYSQREKSRFSILYIRLNDFKAINQRIGHSKADMILREIAQRLSHAVRRSDTVARISDNVFAVLLRHTFNHADITRVCNNLRAILHAPIFVQQDKYDIQTSMGIACFPEDGHDIEILNIRASQAVDAATEKEHHVFYATISAVNE